MEIVNKNVFFYYPSITMKLIFKPSYLLLINWIDWIIDMIISIVISLQNWNIILFYFKGNSKRVITILIVAFKQNFI
jgi:uncharacterized protein YybS (DUF2232 family)